MFFKLTDTVSFDLAEGASQHNSLALFCSVDYPVFVHERVRAFWTIYFDAEDYLIELGFPSTVRTLSIGLLMLVQAVTTVQFVASGTNYRVFS